MGLYLMKYRVCGLVSIFEVWRSANVIATVNNVAPIAVCVVPVGTQALLSSYPLPPQVKLTFFLFHSKISPPLEFVH